ncbi:MAG: hypothetical protein L6V93_12975 [Clostridiales bacterium]|nr:MAG: hypothetical protein L6V93_12975 [Clostridiales bacterium]
MLIRIMTLSTRINFSKTTNGVTEIYYNPDSNAGGQLVELTIYNEDILDAAKLYKKPQDFSLTLREFPKGTLCDVGTKEFQRNGGTLYRKQGGF